MFKSFFLIGTIFLVLGIAKPTTDSDCEFVTGEPCDESPLEVFYVSEARTDQNRSFQVQNDTIKREVPVTISDLNIETTEAVTKPTVYLSDLIGKIEGSVVRLAFNAVSFTKVVHNYSDPNSASSDSATNSTRTINKRTVEMINNDSTAGQTKPIFQYLTAKSIPATKDEPTHITIDRVAVFNSSSELTPLIENLDFHALVHSESSTQTNDRKDGEVTAATSTQAQSSTASTILKPGAAESSSLSAIPMSVERMTTAQSISSVEGTTVTGTTPSTILREFSSSPMESKYLVEGSALDSNVSSEAAIKSSPSTELSSSSMGTTSTTTTPNPPTTKTPKEKLKEAEEDLKEKVAEIEAEPIILSARV